MSFVYAPPVGGSSGQPAIPFGSFASLPAASSSNNGALVVTTDGSSEFASNGSAWLPIIDGVQGVLPVPTASLFSPVSGTTGDLIDSGGSALMVSTVTNGDMQMWDYAGVPTLSFTACIRPIWKDAAVTVSGIYIRDSASEKFLRFALYNSTTPSTSTLVLQVQRFTDRATVGAVAYSAAAPPFMYSEPIWLTASFSGGNILFRAFQAGRHPMTIYTETQATWVTSPDKFGICSHGNGSAAITTQILSAKQV